MVWACTLYTTAGRAEDIECTPLTRITNFRKKNRVIEMDAQKLFQKFTLGFRQGTLDERISDVEWIRGALNLISATERKQLANSLLEFLSSNPTGPGVQKLWNESAASYFIADDEELRSFLKLVVKLADDQPP